MITINIFCLDVIRNILKKETSLAKEAEGSFNSNPFVNENFSNMHLFKSLDGNYGVGPYKAR